MNSREHDVQMPCHVTFKRFYIKKVIINRRPKVLQKPIKEGTKIAFGCNIKSEQKDRFGQPALFYDKKYTCIDKHFGVPIISSPRNNRAKSEYDVNDKIKRVNKFEVYENQKSLSLSFQQQKNNNQFKQEPKYSDPLNYINRLLPMTMRQLRESFIMNKHQSNHQNLEAQ